MMDSGIGIGGLSTAKDETATSKFNLFEDLEIETGVSKIYTQTFHPISTTDSKGPFIFEIPADPEKFTDAESFLLLGRMRIRARSGGVITNLPSDENVSTVNNIFNSLWSSINVQLNDTEITDPSSRWYAFKSYFENHLSYSTPTKENILAFRGYIKDTPGKYEDVGNASTPSTNEGYIKRKKCLKGVNGFTSV